MLPSSTSGRSITCACSSRRSTSPSWQPAPWRSAGWSSSCFASRPSSSWRAVGITSDSVGAITSLSPPLGMGGTAECLGSKDIWVSRVAWKDLTPGALFGPSAAGCGCASSLTSRPLGRGGVPRRWASVQAAVEDWWLTARRRSGREGRERRSGLGGCRIRAQARRTRAHRLEPGDRRRRGGVPFGRPLDPPHVGMESSSCLSSNPGLSTQCAFLLLVGGRNRSPPLRPGLSSLFLLVVAAREPYGAPCPGVLRRPAGARLGFCRWAPGCCWPVTRRRSPAARWCAPPAPPGRWRLPGRRRPPAPGRPPSTARAATARR
jgi:hypothetical protein